MTNTYVISGTLTDARTLVLDEELPVRSGRAKVVVELTPQAAEPIDEYIRKVWDEQTSCGRVPPVRADVDAYIQSERDSWGD